MAGLNEVNQRRVIEEGTGGKGGLFGGIGGALLGGLAGALSMNPAAAVSLASAGYGVGSTVGGAAFDTPDKMKETKRVGRLQNAAQSTPDGNLAALQNARLKIAESPEIDAPTANQYLGMISGAENELKKRMKMMGA